MYIPVSVSRPPAAWPRGFDTSTSRARPEVEHPDRSRGVEHQVGRLDVAMDDPLGVRRRQPARRLDQEVDRQIDRQRTALADDAVQVAPSTYSITRKWTPRSSLGIERGDDVRVLEAGRRPRPRAGTAARRAIAGEGGGRIFKATTRSEPAVPGLEDDTHAAGAQPVEDQVVADLETAALALVDGRRLVGRQLASPLEDTTQAKGPIGRRYPRDHGRQLIGADQADLDKRPAELVHVRHALRPDARERRAPSNRSGARPVGGSRALEDRRRRIALASTIAMPLRLGQLPARGAFAGLVLVRHGALSRSIPLGSRRRRVIAGAVNRPRSSHMPPVKIKNAC